MTDITASADATYRLKDLAVLRERFLANGDERDLPIIDAHMHIWDPTQNPHPWLCDEPMIEFRYGDYSAIRRPYLPEEHRQAAGAAHCLVSGIYMEAEWQPGGALDEVKWVAEMAARTGWPDAMIAQAWLDHDDIDRQLDILCRQPLVRGIRHKPTARSRLEHLGADVAPQRASLSCPRYQAGVAEVARRGLIFELQIPWWHLEELVPLLDRHPEMPVVINHAGVPGDRHPDTLREWSHALAKVAAWPQVMIKFSGLGLPNQPWHVNDNREVFDIVLRHFGIHRVMFASNFPVDSLVTSLDALLSGFKHLSHALTPEHRLKLFCDNAVRCYALSTTD